MYANEKISLNDEQCKVVNELSQNILLLASAGTGKTRTLAYRIVNILNQSRAKPEEILCLTFTNRACKEMKERIISIVGKDALDITVRTFHSFCHMIAKAEIKKIEDLPSDFIIYDEEDCKEIIENFVKFRFSTRSIQDIISFIKLQTIVSGNNDYKRIISEIKQKRFDDLKSKCVGSDHRYDENMLNYILSEGHKLVNDYNKALFQNHAVDFDDLLIIVSNLFKDENTVRKWRTQYKYIHIDEVQDTSEIEYSILSKLFHDNNIMLCGDYFQTIYEWRGSNPKRVMDSFTIEYDPEFIIFDKNYRATKKLLEATYSYLENVFKLEVEKVYRSRVKPKSKEEGDYIILKTANNISNEAEWIFKKIIDLNVDDISKIAILTRNNNLNSLLSKEFDKINSTLPKSKQLKFMLVDDYKFFRRQEIKDVLAFLKVIVNKYDSNSFKRILLKFAEGIGPKTIEAIESKEGKSLGINITDFLDSSTFTYSDPYYLLLQELYKNNIVIFDVESTGISTTEDDIVQIAAIKINSRGEVIEKFLRFLKPSKPIGTSQLIHGFSDEFLCKHGEDAKTVLSEFIEFAKGTLLVGHNVSYDIGILSSQLTRLGLPRLHFVGSYDTLDICRRFYPDLPNYKLKTLCDYFNTSVKSSHDAADDILATKDILMKVIHNIIPLLNARMAYYKKYMDRFGNIFELITQFKKKSLQLRPHELIKLVIRNSRILDVYKDESKRLDNIFNFYHIAECMDQPHLCCEDSLIELLKITSLSNSELDRITSKYPQIPIITVHQAKGAEFDYVFLAGLQEYVFPSYHSIKRNNLIEEKRTFYVAITRAKKQLFLSWSMYDERGRKTQSRFIEEIPGQYIKRA